MVHGMQIDIFDISGNLVYTNKELNHNNQIDLSSLSQGVYVVKLIKNDKIDIRKIQIEK
jgi:hypothetical protein